MDAGEEGGRKQGPFGDKGLLGGLDIGIKAAGEVVKKAAEETFDVKIPDKKEPLQILLIPPKRPEQMNAKRAPEFSVSPNPQDGVTIRSKVMNQEVKVDSGKTPDSKSPVAPVSVSSVSKK